MIDWRGVFSCVSWGAIFVLGSPIILARHLCALCFDWLCRLQDFLSETRRRQEHSSGRKDGSHRQNRATQLPVETQLHIFALLSARAKFGRTQHVMDVTGSTPHRPGGFSACRDLAAARLVCRAWHGAATEALYADATLVTARACAAFADLLARRPQVAPMVRRIVFPEDSRRVNEVNTEPSIRNLKALIDQIVGQCLNAMDVTFFRNSDSSALEDVPGINLCAVRVTHLALLFFFEIGIRHFALDFGADSLQQFPNLQSLTLRNHRIDAPATVHFPAHTLRSLHLEICFLPLASFRTLLTHLPNLLAFSWRENTLAHDYSTDAPALPELLAPSLTEYVAVDHLESPRHTALLLRGLDAFAALHRLTISAWLLPRMRATPHALAELIVTQAPYHSSEQFTNNGQWRRMMLKETWCLVHSAPWTSPALRSIQLWDIALLTQLPLYRVVSYILREALQPRGIEVAVNLFLDKDDELRVRRKMRRRHRARRLLWQDVI